MEYDIVTSSSYIESLVNCRANVSKILLKKLDAVIELELDLALIGAEKARSEILRGFKTDDKVRPIK